MSVTLDPSHHEYLTVSNNTNADYFYFYFFPSPVETPTRTPTGTATEFETTPRATHGLRHPVVARAASFCKNETPVGAGTSPNGGQIGTWYENKNFCIKTSFQEVPFLNLFFFLTNPDGVLPQPLSPLSLLSLFSLSPSSLSLSLSLSLLSLSLSLSLSPSSLSPPLFLFVRVQCKSCARSKKKKPKWC